jgi:RimJ/RimL family protein N-acetyltransferase
MQWKDKKSVTTYVSNPRVTRFLTWKAYKNEKLIVKYMEKAISKTSYPDEVLVIEYKGMVIGTIHMIERLGRAVQFGFGIIPSYWGYGFGRIVIKSIIEYIRKTAWNKCKVIWADVHRDNIWVQKQLLSCGFTSGYTEVEPSRYRFIFVL